MRLLNYWINNWLRSWWLARRVLTGETPTVWVALSVRQHQLIKGHEDTASIDSPSIAREVEPSIPVGIAPSSVTR